ILAAVVGFLNVPQGLLPGFPDDKAAAFHHFLAPVVDEGAHHVATSFLGYAGEEPVVGPLVMNGATGEGLVLSEAMHHSEVTLALVSTVIAIAGLVIAYLFFGKGISNAARKTARSVRPLWSMSWNRWWWDDF